MMVPGRQLLRRPCVLTPLRPLTSIPSLLPSSNPRTDAANTANTANTISSSRTPVAGPSTRQIGSARAYTTRPEGDGTPLETSDDSLSMASVLAESDRLVVGAGTGDVGGDVHGKRPADIPEEVEIPPNVRFEGWEDVEEPVVRGGEWRGSLSRPSP